MMMMIQQQQQQQQQQQRQQQQRQEEEQQPQSRMPIGYKFRPTDRELLFHFLKNKLKNPTMFKPAAPIHDIQLYDHHPKIILDQYGVQGPNNKVECYVFTTRHRKFLSWDRANRILKDNVGYWRASYNHADQFQESRRGGGLVGEKMNLVYYDQTTSTTSTNTSSNTKKKGTKKGTKTDWLMNEYKIKPADNDDGAEEDLVLCRIYLNNRQRNKAGSNHQHQQEQQYMQQEQVPYLQQQEQVPYLQQEQVPYLQQQEQVPYLQQEQVPYLQQQEQVPNLQQQEQEQQPAAVDDQASNPETYSIDTEIDVDTLWELTNQEPEQQQTGVDMISIDDYA